MPRCIECDVDVEHAPFVMVSCPTCLKRARGPNLAMAREIADRVILDEYERPKVQLSFAAGEFDTGLAEAAWHVVRDAISSAGPVLDGAAVRAKVRAVLEDKIRRDHERATVTR